MNGRRISVSQNVCPISRRSTTLDASAMWCGMRVRHASDDVDGFALQEASPPFETGEATVELAEAILKRMPPTSTRTSLS